MQVTMEPSLENWRPEGGRGVLATGHQAGLWHPGILAKDLTLVAGMKKYASRGVHVVVDTDVNEALTLELPLREGMYARAEQVVLGKGRKLVPTGAQEPVDGAQLKQTWEETRARLGDKLACDAGRLQEAVEAAAGGVYRTLAEQAMAMVQRLWHPWVNGVELVYESRLGSEQALGDLLGMMREDPRKCVEAYNQAARAQPEGGIAPLKIDTQRVELPLWWMAWGRQRLRVFADVSQGQAVLVDEQRRKIDLPAALDPEARDRLVPRALLLSALWRGRLCDLFIHGKGGGKYDQVMEAWWREWLGQPLAPLAVVSADLHLDLGVPLAGSAQVARALWWEHHLAHNVDRALQLTSPPAERKRALITQMNADRDRRRRAHAFQELHAINTALREEHPDLLRQAREDVARLQAGLANRAVAMKRDWCLGCYAPAQLENLSRQIAAKAGGAAGDRK